MSSKFFLTTILVAAFTTGCSKQVEKSAVKDDLVGTWQWERTDGGLAFHIHETPASADKNIDLNISRDGKYSIITNGAVTSDGSYVLETRKCIHDGTNKTVINSSSSSDPDAMIENIDKKSLNLSDEMYDGLGFLYKRNK